jgi:hypothetical protein
MLRKIRKVHLPDAIRLLQFLVYSARPLTIGEAVDAVLVDFDSHPSFDPELRMPDPEEIALICPGLISMTRKTHLSLPPWASESDYDSDSSSWSVTAQTGVAIASSVQKEIMTTTELQIAHLSVREYLVSGRVQVAVLREGLEKTAATIAITNACLAYMSYLGYRYRPAVEAYVTHCGTLELNSRDAGEKRRDLSRQVISEIQKSFPLADYAAYNWSKHAICVQTLQCIQERITALLRDSQSPLCLWSHLYMGDVEVYFYKYRTPGPITCLYEEGLEHVVRALLEGFVHGNSHMNDDIADCFENVCRRGNVELIKLFCDTTHPSNDVMVRGLGAACEERIESGIRLPARNASAIKLLIDNGAVSNPVTSAGPLYDAAIRHNTEVLLLLLKGGARVHDKCFYKVAREARVEALELFLTWDATIISRPVANEALGLASERGYVEVVKLLLDRGAETTSALQRASKNAHPHVVRLLLTHGTSTSAKEYSKALTVALRNTDRRKTRRNQEVLELLENHGAQMYPKELRAVIGLPPGPLGRNGILPPS